MSGYVLDASAAVTMVLLDERTPAEEELVRLIRVAGATVTALWHLEVANVLLMAERRKRLVAAERLAALAILAELPIVIDAATAPMVWGETSILAQVHGLTIYDGSDLELAMRSKLMLATRDKDLVRAAATLGFPVC